jgi:integrase
VPENPCIGVELNKQEARTRYVNQDEFQAFKATTSRYIPLFMELAYLCRARWSEVAALKVSDILDEGVRLERAKGSDSEITAWTPRLRAAVDACRAHHPDAPAPLSGSYLIHDKHGLAIRQNAFQTAWGRAMRKWEAAGNERFTFHDLKAAGYSDQKKQDAGHRSDKMHSTYNRKLRIVEPAE